MVISAEELIMTRADEESKIQVSMLGTVPSTITERKAHEVIFRGIAGAREWNKHSPLVIY